MSSRQERTKRSYDYFVSRLEDKERFELADVAQFVGWSLSTVQSYAAKKWKMILGKDDGKYFVQEMPFDKEQYVRFMSQVHDRSSYPKKPDLDEDTERESNSRV
jgi:hypothetical protein